MYFFNKINIKKKKIKYSFNYYFFLSNIHYILIKYLNLAYINLYNEFREKGVV